MSDVIDPDDYPLSLGALTFLCDNDSWNSLNAAWAAWHIALKEVSPDERQVLITEAEPPRSQTVRLQEQFYGPNKPRRFITSIAISRDTKLPGPPRYRSPAQQLLLDAIHDAEKACKKSAINRMKQVASNKRPQIELLVRERKKYNAGWEILAWDRTPDINFMTVRGNTIRFGAYDLDVRLRDTVGLPIEQAIFLYGEPSVVLKFVQLIQFGAPDHIGKWQKNMFAGAPWQTEHYDHNEFHDIERSLLTEMLRRLRSGELVGIESSNLLPAKDWENVDSLLPPAQWWPGALIRSSTMSERAEVTKVAPVERRGRKTKMPEILERFKSHYLLSDGSLRGSKKLAEIGRELLEWKEKEFPECEPKFVATISERLSEYRKKVNQGAEVKRDKT